MYLWSVAGVLPDGTPHCTSGSQRWHFLHLEPRQCESHPGHTWSVPYLTHHLYSSKRQLPSVHNNNIALNLYCSGWEVTAGDQTPTVYYIYYSFERSLLNKCCSHNMSLCHYGNHEVGRIENPVMMKMNSSMSCLHVVSWV